MRRTSHGLILGENGEKMSKSRGNVVNPDDIVKEFGADTLRTYEMFIGDFAQNAYWTEKGVQGCRKFLERVWAMQDLVVDEKETSEAMERLTHQTIKKVSEDYENLKFNTAIAQLMTFSNEARKEGRLTRREWELYLTLLNPVAPHITEELWELAGFEGHIATDAHWPDYDEEKLVGDWITMPVQINGKVRGKVTIAPDADQETVISAARKDEGVQRHIEGKKLIKVIFVPGKILNIVVK